MTNIMKLTVFATLLLMTLAVATIQAWRHGKDRAVDIARRRSLQDVEVGKSRFCYFVLSFCVLINSLNENFCVFRDVLDQIYTQV